MCLIAFDVSHVIVPSDAVQLLYASFNSGVLIVPDHCSSSGQFLELGHRSHGADLFGQVGDHFDPFAPFGGRDPGELQAVQIDSDELQQFPEGGESAAGVEVAGDVVAVARVAAGDQDAVGPLLEGLAG